MPADNYVITLTTKTHCPTCNKLVDLLTKNWSMNKPMFYICWDCRKIFEVGKGEVRREI